ncbi:MAG: hypothetical protein EOM20_03315 [Spartobacteria bacterium]|nr:hypothetical protein [Spartobacteria bacterium]
MSSIILNMTVTPRRQLAADEDGKYLITPDILNQMARPIVTAEIDEQTIDLPYAVITITEVTAGEKYTVDVQTKKGDANYAQRMRLHAWLTESLTTLAESSTVPDDMDAASWTVVTNTEGRMLLTLEHTSSAVDWYLCVDVCGRVYVSDVIEFTGGA